MQYFLLLGHVGEFFQYKLDVCVYIKWSVCVKELILSLILLSVSISRIY